MAVNVVHVVQTEVKPIAGLACNSQSQKTLAICRKLNTGFSKLSLVLLWHWFFSRFYCSTCISTCSLIYPILMLVKIIIFSHSPSSCSSYHSASPQAMFTWYQTIWIIQHFGLTFCNNDIAASHSSPQSHLQFSEARFLTTYVQHWSFLLNRVSSSCSSQVDEATAAVVSILIHILHLSTAGASPHALRPHLRFNVSPYRRRALQRYVRKKFGGNVCQKC